MRPLTILITGATSGIGRHARPFTSPMIAVLGVAFALVRQPLPTKEARLRWERVRTEDGIVVCARRSRQPFVAFAARATSTPSSSRGQRPCRRPAREGLIDHVVDATILRKVSDTEHIMYCTSACPCLSDRELVTDVTLTLDPAHKSLTVRMRSVSDASAPRTGYVRAQIEDSVFVLASIDGGARTHVTAEIHCDPKGSVPAWIVNLFQRNWGYKTITALRRQAQKPTVTPNAQLQAMLAEKGLLD